MKYIIEIPDDVQYVLFNGKADNKYYTAVRPIAELEELNSDYINEHYGELQDEAYQRGFEDGKKAVSDPDRIEVGDEVEWDGDKYVVTYLNYNIETSEITDYDLLAYDGSVVDHVKKCAFTKTGKHYDIASILEAMRTHD
jgi:glutamine cyclotransferase